MSRKNIELSPSPDVIAADLDTCSEEELRVHAKAWRKAYFVIKHEALKLQLEAEERVDAFQVKIEILRGVNAEQVETLKADVKASEVVQSQLEEEVRRLTQTLNALQQRIDKQKKLASAPQRDKKSVPGRERLEKQIAQLERRLQQQEEETSTLKLALAEKQSALEEQAAFATEESRRLKEQIQKLESQLHTAIAQKKAEVDQEKQKGKSIAHKLKHERIQEKQIFCAEIARLKQELKQAQADNRKAPWNNYSMFSLVPQASCAAVVDSKVVQRLSASSSTSLEAEEKASDDESTTELMI
jgi:chromosome segregation ATPase